MNKFSNLWGENNYNLGLHVHCTGCFFYDSYEFALNEIINISMHCVKKLSGTFCTIIILFKNSK